MSSKKKRPMTHTLLAGGTAGFVESSICHPLDTIKTRMQLRNNHIESVGTRLKHSLVEPAVMHVRHSLMEPALRFKHSLSEAAILTRSSSRRPTHSLVEPANLIKLRRHALHEPSPVQAGGTSTSGISTCATVPTDASNSNSNTNWWSKKASISSSKSGDGNRGIVTKATSSPSTLVSMGESSGAKCWWNQPRQHHIKSAVAETSNRSFQTKNNGFNVSSSKPVVNSSVSSNVNTTQAWWNWHRGSSTALVSRGQSSKSAVWCQSMAKNDGRRSYGTHVDSWSTNTSRKGPLGPIQTARKIIQKEGFSSLYKGLSAVYVGIIPKMAIRFVAFEQYKDLIKRYTNLGDKATNFTAGLSSGLTEAVLIVTPAEVCKIRMQSQRHSLLDPVEANSRKYGNVVQTAIIIVREEGYSALYKGVVPTMLRQGCNQAVNFTVYNVMKDYWLERQRQQNFQNRAFGNSESPQQLPSMVSMLIGGLSGAMGPIVNNPLDVVKTRLQKQNTAKKFNGTPKYTGLIQGCLRISKEEGAGALWKGITPRLMRIVPGQAITFATYEAVCRWL